MNLTTIVGVRLMSVMSIHNQNDTVLACRDVHQASFAPRHDAEEVMLRKMDKVRILFIVPVAAKHLDRAKAVRDTWVKRADKVVYISSENITDFPSVVIGSPEGYGHLTAKTMQGFRYIYDHHVNDADWFMKTDDDSFVIVENLKYFLSEQNSSDPVYFGHLFKSPNESEWFSGHVKQGYYSGGAGYVLSKEALTRLATKGRDPNICRQDGGFEDAELGKCMERLGVATANTTDARGRSRFHAMPADAHLIGRFAEDFIQIDANGARYGMDTISRLPITFHYVEPVKMLELELYIYHVRPYGVRGPRGRLNADHRNRLVDEE